MFAESKLALVGNDAIFTGKDGSGRENCGHEKGIRRVHQDYLTYVSTEAETHKAGFSKLVHNGTQRYMSRCLCDFTDAKHLIDFHVFYCIMRCIMTKGALLLVYWTSHMYFNTVATLIN